MPKGSKSQAVLPSVRLGVSHLTWLESGTGDWLEDPCQLGGMGGSWALGAVGGGSVEFFPRQWVALPATPTGPWR